MKTSDKGIELIKQFEGCRLVVYLDPVGIPTVGVGHTKGLTKTMVGKRITQAEADNYLRMDLSDSEKAVNALGLDFNQNQFDALVSFTFNCGAGNLKKLCTGRNKVGIGNALTLYVKAGGKTLSGLVRRRNAEKQLYFNTPHDTENPYKCPKNGVIKQGSKGEYVRWLQWELNRYGANLVTDGVFGQKTEKALMEFQRKHDLIVDGKCGTQTRKSLTSN